MELDFEPAHEDTDDADLALTDDKLEISNWNPLVPIQFRHALFRYGRRVCRIGICVCDRRPFLSMI